MGAIVARGGYVGSELGESRSLPIAVPILSVQSSEACSLLVTPEYIDSYNYTHIASFEDARLLALDVWKLVKYDSAHNIIRMMLDQHQQQQQQQEQKQQQQKQKQELHQEQEEDEEENEEDYETCLQFFARVYNNEMQRRHPHCSFQFPTAEAAEEAVKSLVEFVLVNDDKFEELQHRLLEIFVLTRTTSIYFGAMGDVLFFSLRCCLGGGVYTAAVHDAWVRLYSRAAHCLRTAFFSLEQHILRSSGSNYNNINHNSSNCNNYSSNYNSDNYISNNYISSNYSSSNNINDDNCDYSIRIGSSMPHLQLQPPC